MSNVIDITNTLAMRKAAEILGLPTGRIHVHPDDTKLFDFVDSNKVVTSTIAEKGKPIVFDLAALEKLFRPDFEMLRFEPRAFNVSKKEG